ncbi:MAG: gluconate 5-dehydrogenase [Deltaproteobacteria bacterium SG8_13]|nr:MAG: gluconate 5-dehydrogenase [Deltaproteobacteria bacterium SG8_13]
MSTSLFDLKGKTALITGSSRGLGHQIARGLGHAGATLILNGRNKETLLSATRALREEGLTVSSLQMDVLDEDQIEAQVPELEKNQGPIDILVNNAGIQRRGKLEHFDRATWQSVLDTNLTSAFLVSRQVVKGMISRNAGKIINICSLMSEVGRQTTGPYTASKGGLKMLTKAMAAEWGAYNIQANGIGPGYFLTEMTQTLAEDPDFDGWVKNRTPARRWGLPAELIGTAIYLASAASDFVNGQIIYVDGGILASL